ncbi:hypothetical protein ACF0H5_019003 [Mactra antiquata]
MLCDFTAISHGVLATVIYFPWCFGHCYLSINLPGKSQSLCDHNPASGSATCPQVLMGTCDDSIIPWRYLLAFEKVKFVIFVSVSFLNVAWHLLHFCRIFVIFVCN